MFLPCSLGTGCALLVERRSRRSFLAGYVATVVRGYVRCERRGEGVREEELIIEGSGGGGGGCVVWQWWWWRYRW